MRPESNILDRTGRKMSQSVNPVVEQCCPDACLWPRVLTILNTPLRINVVRQIDSLGYYRLIPTFLKKGGFLMRNVENHPHDENIQECQKLPNPA